MAPNALIFGCGAVGAAYGYRLHQAGATVTAVCRSNYDVITSDGIEIEWDRHVSYRPRTARTSIEARSFGPFDYVLVCTKAFPGTARSIEAAVDPQTVIVLLQNGIGIEDEYAETYPGCRVISGVVWLPAKQTMPGKFKIGAGMERLEVGAFPSASSISGGSSSSFVNDFAQLWKKGRGKIEVFDNVQEKRWRKLALNAAFNPICALTRCDGANLLRSSDMADSIIVRVMREVGAVAAATGCPAVTEGMIEQDLRWHRSKKRERGKVPSMLVDVRHGRPLEIEAILGNALKIAHKSGIAVPNLDMLHCLCQGLDFSIRQPHDWLDPAI